MAAGDPVLWHITFSNYNEKARWALDFKGVPHSRREAPPGMHPLWAWRLARVRTFPVLVVDGRGIGDSTRIVAELERRHPDPPLYPADPAERTRALELEDLFDERLGHEVRRLAMDAVRRDPDLAVESIAPGAEGLARRALRAAAIPMGAGVRRYYDVNPRSVERAWELVGASIDHFQRELGARAYLVGDRFTVADLTFAALLGTGVQPEGFPYPAREPRHRGLPELRSLLAERGVLEWIEEIYARHRGAWTRAS
jgi:glutathione S-transferase